MAWCAGCLGGDDYAEGIAEAVDVQAMNVRTSKEKTYHLVLFTFPGEGMVRNAGKDVFFSANDAVTAKIALHYGQKKWEKGAA